MKTRTANSGVRSVTRENKVPEMLKPLEAAAAPPQIAVSLHPLMSFELRCAKEGAPQINSQWRWSYQGNLYYIQILKASEEASEPGRIMLVGGVFHSLNPAVADLPEATFLRGSFAPPPQL